MQSTREIALLVRKRSVEHLRTRDTRTIHLLMGAVWGLGGALAAALIAYADAVRKSPPEPAIADRLIITGGSGTLLMLAILMFTLGLCLARAVLGHRANKNR